MITTATPPKIQTGFSLIETMVAILILSFGVLALVAVYTQGVAYMQSAEYDYIAQQKAAEAIETIFTARDTKLITWNQIRNVGGASGSDGGVFLDGPLPLLDPGRDGLVGTADDDVTRPDSIVMPGPDGVLGDADDIVIVLNMFTREILIRDIAPNLRQVTVIMRYRAGRMPRQVTLVSYISAFA